MSAVISGRDVVVVRDGQVALASSTFTVPEAAITAVIGPNGSGKSTLLHAATGLLPLESGTLEVLGKTSVEGRRHCLCGAAHEREPWNPDDSPGSGLHGSLPHGGSAQATLRSGHSTRK